MEYSRQGGGGRVDLQDYKPSKPVDAGAYGKGRNEGERGIEIETLGYHRSEADPERSQKREGTGGGVHSPEDRREAEGIHPAEGD